jgi:acyl-CoA thioester hydrolase
MDAYVKRFEARWSDLDVNRHMRNTAYVEYAIDVRLGLLRDRGFGLGELARRGFGPVIAYEDARYSREIGPDETFEVDFRVAGLAPDGSRWRIEHVFTRGDGKKAAVLRVEGVWLDLRTRRPIPPPPELDAALREAPRADEYEELAPAGRP